MVRSRLSRNLEKQSRKQLLVFGLGTLVILIIIAKFGVTILEGVTNITHKKESDTVHQVSFDTIQPPSLDSVPDATKSQTISVNGSTFESGGTVELYVNNKEYATTDVQGTEFTFDSVRLKAGQNELKVRQLIDDKVSEFSTEYRITYAKDAPKLEISFPSEGQEFKSGDQEIDIIGKTEAENKLTVNSFFAIVENDGSFRYHIKLNEGDNTIKIEAENLAGVKTTKELKVSFHP